MAGPAISVNIALACILNVAVFSLSLAEHTDENEDISSDFHHDFIGELCHNPLPPMFGELRCGSHKTKKDKYVCKAECESGYQFPNGKVKKRHICDLTSGKWSPEYEFPDCEPICDPPCENHGQCNENNHCICTPGYRGDRCQFATRLCDPSDSLHVSADWKCNHTSFDTLCILNCPQGTQYESPPAEIYRCSLDGQWTPDIAPKCLPINIIEPPISHGLFPIATGRMENDQGIEAASSGVCAVWGQLHYRTFDGGMFSFQGPCSYLLAKDCAEDTFAVHIGNMETCNSPDSCETTVTIYLGKEEHQLLVTPDGPSVLWQGKTYPIPTSLNGLLFQMLSNYITVTSAPLGFRLKWNGQSTILLKVNDQLKNKTCGLCGRFDGTVLNDFETADGKITDNVEAFVNSWTMETLIGTCSDGALVQHPCTSVEKETAIAANKICEVILEARYSSCHYLVDPRAYSEACKMDYCKCSNPNPDCICSSLAEYFRECMRLGGKIEGGWRNEDLCPLPCSKGMVYDDCGTSCPRTCKDTVYDCEDSHCVDGCHCPAGTVMSNGQCIEKQHCPCTHKGKEYSNGERVTQECNACECIEGKWECTKEKCEARCSSVGDPHYTTFDGSKYEFLGSCPYYLVYHQNFSIIQQNGPCTKEGNGVEMQTTSEEFCTESITIEFLDSKLVFKPNTEPLFNGKEIHSYPFSENGFTVSLASSMFFKIELPNDLSLMWDGKNRVYIDAPPSLFGQTKGLCGTFNNNQRDDFLTPDNDVEADVTVFASKWKVTDSCHKRSRRSERSPCGLQPQKAAEAEALCALMKSAIFEECHDDVDPDSFYKGCIFDLCACSQDLEACLCPALADYSAACARKGSIIHWAEKISACRPHCENGQIYQECGNPCTSTCLTISSSENCKEKCVQGCSCPDGMTLNGDGFCVPIDQCPCIYEGKEYASSSVKLQGTNNCKCESAVWKCKPATLEELAHWRTDLMVDDQPLSCHGKNREFTNCVEDCPSTCQNMHLPQKCKTTNCKPGCRCKDGYVLDSDLDQCVQLSRCGCRHGGRKYNEAETIRKDCNLCTCETGSWKCTEKVCPGVCTAWGESHFKTFDDRIYDFQGDCEYILSKGLLETSAFTLSIQNVPCGTSKVTCSKSFTLDLGGGSKITLSRGESLPQNKIGSRFSILEVGFFVSVYTDIGLSLQWDKGTRIYITLDPTWRDKVVGLCGNFNDDQSDDFQTPSGGLPEARPTAFADSWKIQEFCAYPLAIEDTCSIHPDRQNWAHQKCAILKSDLFAPCHSEIALDPYHERCVFDACACDIGGDCECLCTAIAAYAQECNVHGVPIKWRSQELCPIQCEECATYESCMAPCPRKTCENQQLFDEEVCAQETCVEGCNPKACPPGQVYNSNKDLKCIPQAECVIPCMEINGKVYNEGERISDLELVDACQSCHCLKGDIICTGQPCPTTTERFISEMWVPCSNTGWTPWMNTPQAIGGDFEILKNFELKSVYTKYCGLNNATSIECRDAESKVPYKETGQNVICELPIGLSCRDSDQSSSICHDYEIRIFCECGMSLKTLEEAEKPEPQKPLLPQCLAPGWTFWMNSNAPDHNGDRETIQDLRMSYAFCDESNIEKVECRSVTNGQSYEFGGENVLCSKNSGLICKNSADKICDDYEIRFYCSCEKADCDYPRGMENGLIKPSQMIISSFWMEDTDQDKARLNGPSAWRTGNVELKQWIKIDLEEKQEITGIITQGNRDGNEWVTSYKVAYSDDGVEYNYVKDYNGEDKIFQGNFDGSSEVRNMFQEPIYARYIELIPLEWHKWISLRLEILGCNRQGTFYIPETTTTVIGCVHGWTEFFNVDNPQGAEDTGDEETIVRIKERYTLCPGGVIEDIECKSFHNGDIVDYKQTGQFGLKCSKRVGFVCNNHLQSKGEQCNDYMVRFYCSCGPQKPVIFTTELPTTPPPPLSTTPPPPSTMPIPKTCGWTPWLNVDMPKHGPSDEGDHETIELLQKVYHVCEKPDLKMIECRMSLTLHYFNESLQNDLVCDTESGFRCYNKLQIGECYDYEVRLYCLYDWCPKPVLSTQPPVAEETTTVEVTTKNPCPDGQVYDKCAYSCRQTCISFLKFLHSKNECLALEDTDECLEGCRPIEDCSPSNFWRDYATCVPREECTCIMPDGTIVAPNGIVEKDCEKCQCLDNRLSCHQIPGCGETTHTALPHIKITTIPPPMNIEKEDCWTEWVNIDSPHSGGGDFESLGKMRQRFEFCLDPVEIECRTAKSKQKAYDVGQKVQCDLLSGLSCWNSANAESDCFDYEVRFFCPCPGTTVISTLPPSTMAPAPCQNGWTEWFNSHTPDFRGEYETVQSVRTKGGYFCSSDMITAFDCQQVSTPGIQTLQHGVICDLQTGLICRNSDFNDLETCNDYEVRFYCDCPVPKTTTVKTTTTEKTTTMETTAFPTIIPKVETCDYWSEWINDHHPDSSKKGMGTSKKGTKKGIITGDVERKMLLKFQQEDGFCLMGKLSIVECRDAETDVDYSETGDSKLVCSLTSGFRCRGKEQPSRFCRDYKIRYYCECITPQTTTSRITTTIFVPTIFPTTTAAPPCLSFYNIVDGPLPLPDSSLKASTSRDALSGAQNSRLHSSQNADSAGAWIAGTLNSNQYLEIDLDSIQPVYGIITKGRDGAHEWVKSYLVLYSQDGISFDYVLQKPNSDEKEVFTGNYDSESEVKNMFAIPFEARYVRIQPLTYMKEIALRVDLLGCAEGMTTPIPTTTETPPICKDEMGMENGQLSDEQISVSSAHEASSGPSAVRLNTVQTSEHSGGWVAGKLNDEQYVQVDFLEPRTSTGVIIEGRDHVPEWVTAFKVSYSEDGIIWNPVLDKKGAIKVFPGNHDNVTPAVRFFSQAIRSRFLRIHPLKWNNWISMRLEVLGCFEPYPTTTTSITEISTPLVTTEIVCTEETKLEKVSCEVAGSLFSTFDGLDYEYEICNHVLVKDQTNDQFAVTIHKKCFRKHEKCKRYLKVRIDEDIVILGPGLDDLQLNDYEVPMQNLWIVERKYPDFKFYREENQLSFITLKYNLEVTLDSQQNVLIAISKCPSNKVVGLCGFYNGNSNDDRQTPDGSVASNNEEFGSSWSIGNIEQCVPPECPEEILIKATEACSRFNELPLSQCQAYLNIASYTKACMDFMCDCLQQQQQPSFEQLESCKCKVYDTFVTECQNSGMGIIQDWEFLLGCEEFVSTQIFNVSEEYKGITSLPTTPFMFGECKSPMGLGDGFIPDISISVSSSETPESDASRIRLHTVKDEKGTGGWVASPSDFNPSVIIDFDDIKNISGLLTQGREDDDMWVTSFIVEYSQDYINWSYAVDSSTNGLKFKGNSNRNGLVVHLFQTMVEARYIKISIQDYFNAPAMRLEVLGCFKPYVEETLPTAPIITSTELCVEYGPWVSISDPSSSFGDEEPIEKVIEASGKCFNPLRLQCRSLVTKMDYSITGERVICDLTHGLLCKNIDQPSGYCNNYEVRIGCWSCGAAATTTTTTPVPVPVLLCQEVPVDMETSCPFSCPPDYSCDGTSCIPSVDCPCFKEGKRFNPGDIMETSDCQICKCVLEGNSFCQLKTCPPCEEGQKSELSEDCVCSCKGCPTGTELCSTSGQCINSELWCDGIVNCPDDETNCPTTIPPTMAPTTTTVQPPSSTELHCTPLMKSERVTCEMAVNLFHTFDGLEYQYEICDHILMREKAFDLYSVSVHKDCSKGVLACQRYIILQVDDEIIKLGPGNNDLELHGREVPIPNLWLLMKRYPNYTFRKEGNQLVVGSLKYDFEVIWDSRQDVKIIMSKCPSHQVVGLCGFYTGYVDDDRLKSDGFLASGDEEFGDSWGIDNKERCEIPKCPVDIMAVSLEVCQQLNEQPFSDCSSYLNIATRIETCMAFMCECLQEETSTESTESCKCKAYGSFVEACERINNGHLFEWRLQHDCAPKCPPSLEWQDCGPGCELTCDNYRNSGEICTESCIPGCYCPSGLVLHNNRCIKPKMCQDCVCRGHGDPNYISFDGHYYAFQGICTYVLAQHQASDEKLNFQVLSTNVECPEEPHTSCADGITIIWNGHIIKKFKDNPVYYDERELENNDFPFEDEDISISSVASKSFVAHIKQINLVVRYFDEVYGFNIELPSYVYFNETEGLCGICNFEESDDLYHKGGFITEDVDDFAYSWLSSNTRDQCTLPRIPVPKPEPEICNFTYSSCEIFMDPTLYSRSCQNDITYSINPHASMCRSKVQYAQQCCERGISIHEWLLESGCLSSCSEGMILSCTSPCQKTCDNYKSYNPDDCNLKALLTCTCPDDKVLKENQCVDPALCERCDDEGHVIGDTWDKGPCESCSCVENRTLLCHEILCPEKPLCNEKHSLEILPGHPDACCPIYLCKPAARKACPITPVPDCEPGEAAIVYMKEDCPFYNCECQKSLCPPLVKPTVSMEDGERYIVENIGCCQQYVSQCFPENCRGPSKCAPGFKFTSDEGKCCTKYSCVPKKNVCVYQHKFEVINGTELSLPLEQYYDKEYEPDSSWHDGLCRKCSCKDADGQFAYSCIIDICPKPSDFSDADSYVRQAEHIPGSCCPKYHRIQCVSNGVVYSVGDEWPSPDGNVCKSFRCIVAPQGDVTRLEKTTVCDRNCPAHAIYIEPEPESNRCCGYCKPIACEEGGIIYENGASWESITKPCFTAECSVSDNMTQIVYRGHSCPALPPNCPQEYISVDPEGCCKYCEVQPELCSPTEIPFHETIEFFSFVDKDHGLCRNRQLVKNLTKCSGQCESRSFYSAELDDFESTCKCCVPDASRKRMILLDCEDGFQVKKIYHQPLSCSCSSCSDTDRVGTVVLPTPY